MNHAPKLEHEERTREMIVNVLEGLERDERLLWGHRGDVYKRQALGEFYTHCPPFEYYGLSIC